MSKRNAVYVSLIVVVLSLLGGYAQAALNWDGQSGIFLNTLAYPLGANTTEISSHTVNLDTLGSAATYNVAFGLSDSVEVGVTRYSSDVNGIKDQNLLSAKWQFLSETKTTPAVAVWGIQRDLVGGKNATDLGLSVTKALNVGGHTLVADLGVRSTKALWLGLLGVGDKRETKFEGSVALFVTKNFAVGTEFKQQINGRPWRDIAVRYIASNNLNIDAGIANFGPGLDNQIAFAATYKL